MGLKRKVRCAAQFAITHTHTHAHTHACMHAESARNEKAKSVAEAAPFRNVRVTFRVCKNRRERERGIERRNRNSASGRETVTMIYKR